MLIINQDYKFEPGRYAVTIGKFDGLHLGHKKIIDKLIENKKAGLTTIVASFVDHPNILLKSNYKGTLIDRNKKINKLTSMGVDCYCELPFDEKMMNTEAEDFFEEFIAFKWNTAKLVVGDDFTIGKNRRGNVELLKQLCHDNNIEIDIVERLMYDGSPVSSSRIKNELLEGNVSEAEYMLGDEISFEGTVIEGNKIGRTIGLPTINIMPEGGLLLPKFGVYGSLLDIAGKTYKGITNIGVKPTVQNKEADNGNSEIRPLVETNIIDYEGDLYGQHINVRLKVFIRPEKRFNGIEDLKNQIEKDKKYWTKL